MNLQMAFIVLLDAVIAAVEILLVRRIAAAPQEWLVPLSIHVAICSAVLVAGARLKFFEKDRMWPLLTGITVAVAGPIGAVGSGVAVILTVFFNYAAILVCMYGDGLESQHAVQRKVRKQREKAANRHFMKNAD